MADDYDGMLKEQLRELCAQRGLPVSGTNPELASRLRGWDAAHDDEPDLLAEAGMIEPPPDQAPPPVDPAAPPEDPPESLREDPPSESESKADQTVFRSRYAMPDGRPSAVVPTELHQQWLRATEDAAIGAGYRIRGGAARVDYEWDGGVRYAVYEVILGRPRRQMG